MFKQLGKFCENDIYVKTIFDNIKNYAASGFVMIVAGWYGERIKSSTGFFYYYDAYITIMIMIIGYTLWFINMTHGTSKLREFGDGSYGWITVIVFYNILSFSVLMYITLRTY
jgi:hypothetical protein